MKATSKPHLPALAAQGALGIGIPTSHGGSGGSLTDLFHAVAQTAASSTAAARIYAVQRHFAEVLLSSENIAVAQVRLPSIIGGDISGACTVTWPEQALASQACLSGRPAGSGSVLRGALHPVYNVGERWYLVTALLRLGQDSPPGLVLLSSEQDGLHRVPHGGADEGDDHAALTAEDVFFRGDEILQDDVGKHAEHLRQFAALLRCAISAGAATRAAMSMPARERAATQAMVARTVAVLMGAMQEHERMPAMGQLSDACAVLDARILRAAA
ncbi:MAG TPA: hypothetical protein VLJ86_27010 [Ramlibacter sp.]|nr:hypothetical protein [Ramlibacter sp.]